MNLQKKKDKFLKRLEEAENGETVKVIVFKRKHFKDEMSTNKGFGFQDMKDDSKEFYKWLLINDYDVQMVPSGNADDFSLSVTLVKCESETV